MSAETTLGDFGTFLSETLAFAPATRDAVLREFSKVVAEVADPLALLVKAGAVECTCGSVADVSAPHAEVWCPFWLAAVALGRAVSDF